MLGKKNDDDRYCYLYSKSFMNAVNIYVEHARSGEATFFHNNGLPAIRSYGLSRALVSAVILWAVLGCCNSQKL